MGSITFYADGVPVTVSDRTYSLDSETVSPVSPAAFKSADLASDVDELWRTQPSVRKVTGFLARNIAQVPIHAFQRDGRDRDRLDRGHRLSRLMRLPDPTNLITPFEWKFALVIDVCLHDRYAAQVFTDENGAAQLVRLPPSSWKFVRDSSMRAKAIEVTRKDRSTFQVALNKALWVDGFPSDKATSPLQALVGLLAEERLSAEYRSALWANGGRMPGWISRPSDSVWTREARDRFRSGWQQYAAGGVRAGATPLLEDGMEYHELSGGLTPESGQQLESRKFTVAEVASAFGIAPQMVGIIEGSTYSNIAAYRELLYQDTLGSWFASLNEALNVRLVPLLADPDEVFCEFAVAAKLQLAFEDQARIFQTTTGGPIMTRNEARQRLNLPAIEGADELIVPLNVLVGGQASPTDSGSQNER